MKYKVSSTEVSPTPYYFSIVSSVVRAHEGIYHILVIFGIIDRTPNGMSLTLTLRVPSQQIVTGQEQKLPKPVLVKFVCVISLQ